MAGINADYRLRGEIFDLVRETRFQPNQNLRDVKLPEDVYRKADCFTKSDVEHHQYFSVLDKLEGGSIYELLKRAADDSSLEAYDLVGDWIEAFGNLLRYALNLLVAPNRPELKRIKVGGNG